MSGIQILGPDWKYRYVNALAARQARLSREELIGSSLLEQYPGVEATELFRLLEECRRDGISRRFENFFEYPDGRNAWLELYIQSIPEGILITSNDITLRKQMEDEIRIARERAEEREQSITAIYNTVGNVIFKLTVEPNEQYRFESVNEQFLKSTGLAEEQIVGQLVNNIIPEPSLTMVLENYATAIREKRIVRWEEVSRYPTGELTGEVSIAPNYNAEGECTFLVGAVHDITQRKAHERLLEDKNNELQRAKEQAENDEAKIRALTDQSPIAIYTTDLEGRLVYANNKWLETAGISLDAAMGDGWLHAVHPDDREHMRGVWRDASDAGKEWTYDFRFMDAQGNVTWIEGTSRPLYDGKRNLIGYTDTNVDITDIKLAEKAVMESQRVKIIGEMASAIAHDFNNSLQSIMGNVEIALMRGGLPEAARQNLESVLSVVLEATQRARLVQRFGGNNGEIEQRARINVNEVIKSLIKNSERLWKDEVEKQGVQLTIWTDFGDIPDCEAVEGEISAVLLNVLKNSIEAMPSGGNISIRTGRVPGGLRILMQDTGLGMDPETRERVFQPFFTTKGFDLERGLGMSGAYGIINDHGGTISVVKSEPSAGTIIEIRLPRMDMDQDGKS